MKRLAGIVIVFCCAVVFSCESLEEAEAETGGMSAAGQTEDSGAGQEELPAAAALTTTGGTAPRPLNQYRRADSADPDWDIAALDTARDLSYLSQLEKSVILEINKVRSNPRRYARLYVQPELQYYNGRLYRKPGQGRIQTYEGAKAVEDCIAALSVMESAAPLVPESGLSLGARDLAYEQERTGETGHEGSDGSTPFTRIRRYGGSYGAAAENICYGAERAREVVVQLLIDDGMSSRTQRANIMNGNFSRVGVSFCSHPRYKNVCVIIFADTYVSAQTDDF